MKAPIPPPEPRSRGRESAPASPEGNQRRLTSAATIAATETKWRWVAGVAVVARWSLGAGFIYLGLEKALHPAEFLKHVRQYEVVQDLFLLNLIATGLPWFEVLCGLLLIAGVAVRGCALVVVAMLVSFSVLMTNRALDIQSGGDLPFCAIKFNCGCGTGEVNICGKLAGNTLMAGLALALAVRREHRWCWWTASKSGGRQVSP